MKINWAELRKQVLKAIWEYNKSNETNFWLKQFFKHFEVHQGWLYDVAKTGKIWSSYRAKLELMGIDVSAALITDD